MNNIKTKDETYIAAKAILEGQLVEEKVIQPKTKFSKKVVDIITDEFSESDFEDLLFNLQNILERIAERVDTAAAKNDYIQTASYLGKAASIFSKRAKFVQIGKKKRRVE